MRNFLYVRNCSLFETVNDIRKFKNLSPHLHNRNSITIDRRLHCQSFNLGMKSVESHHSLRTNCVNKYPLSQSHSRNYCVLSVVFPLFFGCDLRTDKLSVP